MGSAGFLAGITFDDALGDFFNISAGSSHSKDEEAVKAEPSLGARGRVTVKAKQTPKARAKPIKLFNPVIMVATHKASTAGAYELLETKMLTAIDTAEKAIKKIEAMPDMEIIRDDSEVLAVHEGTLSCVRLRVEIARLALDKTEDQHSDATSKLAKLLETDPYYVELPELKGEYGMQTLGSLKNFRNRWKDRVVDEESATTAFEGHQNALNCWKLISASLITSVNDYVSEVTQLIKTHKAAQSSIAKARKKMDRQAEQAALRENKLVEKLAAKADGGPGHNKEACVPKVKMVGCAECACPGEEVPAVLLTVADSPQTHRIQPVRTQYDMASAMRELRPCIFRPKGKNVMASLAMC